MKSKLLVILLIAVLLFPQVTAQAQSSDPRQMGAQIVARAKKWVDYPPVPYNRNASKDGYRTDCSGFVSYAWQLIDSNNNKISANTDTLKNYAVYIDFAALQPGDAVNNELLGNVTNDNGPWDDGHVVLFVRWVPGKEGTKFIAYEQNSYYGSAVETTLTLIPKGNGYTIKEYDYYAPGPYRAQRYKNIPGFANVVNGLSLSSYSPKVNEYITASFTIRNDGGQTIYIAQLTAGARGPGANSKGWGAPVVDFPTIKNITLQPGQTYYYSQSRSFSNTGDYFAEPVKDQNGWGGIYPYTRAYFNVKK
jgi:hypothetical protein